MISIQTLKDLSSKPEITEMDERSLILYYIMYSSGIKVDAVISAQINDKDLWKKNVGIAKDYFKTIQG